MRRTRALLVSLPLLLLTALSFAQDDPDLSGTWQLDAANSETMREKAHERALERSTSPRARQRWERSETRDRQTMERAPFSRLILVQQGSLVEFRYRDGSVRSIYTDGRDLGADEARGIKGGTAGWKERRLVIENRTARGARTERWELSEDGKRLFVTFDVQAGESYGTLSFRRVYDLQPDAPEAVSGENRSENAVENDGPD